MPRKIIFPLLALTIMIIGVAFLFTSNILILNPQLQESIPKDKPKLKTITKSNAPNIQETTTGYMGNVGKSGHSLEKTLELQRTKITISENLVSDEINTECEWLEFLTKPQNLKEVLYISIQNSGDIKQRYWAKGDQKAGTKQEIEEAHSLLRDIFAEIVVENYPINPKLTNFVARTLVESESLHCSFFIPYFHP